MNSLCDRGEHLAALAASAAGVKIELIVRDLLPEGGIPDVSENISVRSIMEPSWNTAVFFYFENGGQQ